jgi:hypothetical protein
MNELSILVPCPSKVDSLPAFVDVLSQYFMGNPGDVEIIIVTNEREHSILNIADYIQKKYPWLKFRLLQKRGRANPYGALVRFGLAYSTSRYAVLVSPYGVDDISIINNMLSLIRKGAQVVQATRFSNPRHSKTVQWKFRMYQNVYRLMTMVLLGVKVSDSMYGFKMFDRVFIQSLGLTQNSRAISPEITLKGILSGGRVEYVPSGIREGQIGAKFKLEKDGPGYLWLLIRGFFHRTNTVLWF